jgi:group I intron endonuclease
MVVENKLHYIYVLKDENGSVFYVGQTINPKKRCRKHLYEAKYNKIRFPVSNKVRKLIQLGIDKKDIFKIIESNIKEEDVDDKEKYYINFFKSKGIKLKNLTSGGRSGGNFVSNTTIEKIRKIHLGSHRTKETCQRISESKRGIKFSQGHKDALKEAWKTRPPMPVNWGERMSKLNKGKINIKKFIVLSPDDEQFITEAGLTDFCRYKSLSTQNLHKTWKGDRKHHKGWRIIGEA